VAVASGYEPLQNTTLQTATLNPPPLGDYELRQKDAKRAVLYGAEELSDKVADKICSQMIKVLRSHGKWHKKERAETPLSEEEESALRALGYLD
jgi:hypothetical protein